MDIRPRSSLVAAVLLAVALAACSDDDSPTGGGPNDDTPPVVSTVTPIDDHNIDITFDEQVTKGSAENEDNYTIILAPVPFAASRGVNGAVGGGVTVAGATLKNDAKTVTVSTQQSMAGLNLEVTVHNVSDLTGNVIGEAGSSKSFAGSNTTDVTAPTVVEHAPLANGHNIAVNPTVVVQFSEALQSANALWFPGGAGSASAGVSPSPAGGVSFTMLIDGAKLTLTPNAPLEFNTTYTVSVSGTDFSGNAGSNTQWSFTTLVNNDHTPPTLVSTSPANLATGVNVNSNLSMTFSEEVNQSELNILLVPDPGDGLATWSNGGKTVTFDPTAPLLADQSYTLTIYPNGVFDLAGNGIDGLHTVTFTTAAQLASGSIAGTITGDAGSEADDPTGATVIAADGIPFSGPFNIIGSVKVAANNTYAIPYLSDDVYYLLCVMDTSGDGDLDPGAGDAIGAYGVDFATSDFNPDSVYVSAGAHVTGNDFTLFDPSAVTGTVTYTGTAKGDYSIFVGLFDTTGWSITDLPVIGTVALNFDNEWGFNTLDQEFPEDDYYVGAFMDINGNQAFDPLIDPAGFYGGIVTPTVLHIVNGNDITGIVIHITDPTPGLVGTASVLWPKATHNPAFQSLVEAVRQSQLQASR